MDIIEAMADCIMRFEGWIPPGDTNAPRGSHSWRNRNPGNLRPFSDTQPRDTNNYRVFDNLQQGWMCLTSDIALKLSCKSIHNFTSTSTLLDFFNTYAPSSDQNNPTQYSDQIAAWLSKIYNAQVTSQWTFAELNQLGVVQNGN